MIADDDMLMAHQEDTTRRCIDEFRGITEADSFRGDLLAPLPRRVECIVQITVRPVEHHLCRLM